MQVFEAVEEEASQRSSNVLNKLNHRIEKAENSSEVTPLIYKQHTIKIACPLIVYDYAICSMVTQANTPPPYDIMMTSLSPGGEQQHSIAAGRSA